MVNKESIITVAMLVLVTYTLSLSLVSQAFPAGQSTKTLSSTGSIQVQASEGIGIYTNVECTTPLTSLSWGTLEPGTNQNIDFYIKNEATSPTTLSLLTSNWAPSAATDYLTLTWDYDNQPISSGSSVLVTLTLAVDEGITGITSFSFDVTIIGST